MMRFLFLKERPNSWIEYISSETRISDKSWPACHTEMKGNAKHSAVAGNVSTM